MEGFWIFLAIRLVPGGGFCDCPRDHEFIGSSPSGRMEPHDDRRDRIEEPRSFRDDEDDRRHDKEDEHLRSATRMSSTRPRSASGRRPVTAMWAPCSASVPASARPMSLAPPVTSATRPSTRTVSLESPPQPTWPGLAENAAGPVPCRRPAGGSRPGTARRTDTSCRSRVRLL